MRHLRGDKQIKNTHRSMNKFIMFSVAFFLIILIAGTAAFIFSMRQITSSNKVNELSRVLELERIKLETSLNAEIAIVLKLADSPLIKRYFLSPGDAELEKVAFEEIASYRRAFTGYSIFWINDIDRIFYSDDNNSYWVDAEGSENYWYKLTLYETEVYNFNINYNPDIDEIKLWINAPVFDDEHNPIGMVGTGIELSEFINAIYQDDIGRAELYLFNVKGEITGAKNIEPVTEKKKIEEELGDIGAAIFAEARNLKSDEIQTFDVPSGKAAVGTIPVLRWYAVAVISDSLDDYMTPMTVLFLAVLVLILLIFVIFNVFISKFLKSLHRTMESLENASKAKSDFLARTSHEIRTPMNAIMGMSELILREELSQGIYENAQGIRNASINLLSIINDILDFSKIESGMLEIVEAEYLFPSLINDVINVIRMRLLEKPVHFAVCIDNAIPVSLRGDEVRVRQILLNVLSNAVKYTKEGFVSLSVSGEMNDGVATLEITVADTGIGIKKEDIDKLFGEFSRLDMAINKGVEGTGLGLAITRNLCRVMGGDITVRSDYGTGSEFIVTLPQRYDTYTPCAVAENPDEKSVLLYETREAYRDSVVCTLNMLGVRCENAESIAMMFERVPEYPYLFISSFMYESVKQALAKFKNPPRLVLIADVKETIAPMDAEVLAMPAHAISIANILNGVREEHGRVTVTGVSFTAPDARILIVDDISANLKVAEGLMTPYEMQIDLSASGKDAIRMIQENTYDIVFMDHMMPEMDGLEATAIIRALEGERYQTLPIIALTANAVSGIREMFVQNGMNDFLAKPIETTKLNTLLERWIPKEKRRKMNVSESGTAYASDESLDSSEAEDFIHEARKLKWLSVNKASSAVGGSTAYERVFRLSVKFLPKNVEKLDAYINSDLPLYAVEVHGIKSVLNGIGAYSLGEEAAQLEKLSKAGDAETCKRRHPSFIGGVRALLEAAAPLLAEEEKQRGELTKLSEALSEVEQAMEAYDGLLALEILSPLAKYTYGRLVDALLEKLVGAFERFDFDNASDYLWQLINCVGDVTNGTY